MVGVRIIALIAFALPSFASAQSTPSSALLLEGERGPVEDSLESSRYKARPKSTVEVAPVGPVVPRRRASVPAVTPAPATVQIPAAPPVSSAAVVAPKPEESPGAVIEAGPDLRAPIEPVVEDDRRQNLLELDIAPFYVYNGSDSPATHRRYSASSTGMSAAGRIWFTPTFGAQARYASTFAASVSDSLTSGNRVGADHDWTQVGLRSRRFFSAKGNSASLTFGVDYWAYEFNVPTEATLREKIRTTGVGISLEGDFPTSSSYAWTVRLSAVPRARHEESSTQNTIRSGGSPETNVVDLGLGGRLSFDRSNDLYWRLSHRVEQTRFSGPSSAGDAQTGSILSGVTVMNSFTFFEFGYSWGN